MPMPSQDRAAILLLSGTLALMNVACSRINSLWLPNESPEPIAASSPPSIAVTPPVEQASSPVVNPSPMATPTSQPSLSPQEAYERALDAAYSATTIAQSAQSFSDWQLVINRWQEAIQLLQRVPSSSSYYAIAKEKLSQYQRNLSLAQQQAKSPRPSSPAERTIAISPGAVYQPLDPTPSPTLSPPLETESKTNTDNPQVFKIPIKRRVRGTPVINVTFNGSQTFEMVVDTGASGTVITQAMAQSLGIVPEGEVKANTASAKGVRFGLGRVESIAVGGAVAKNVQVAIGVPELEIGLLGQDFYSKYDVSIKQDVVEFHSR